MENWEYLDELVIIQADETHSKAVQKQQKMARKRQEKWDKKHLRTVSTKLKKEEYCELLDACKRWGEKPYTLLRRLLRSQVLGRDS